MGRVVDVKAILAGIKVNLILPVSDRVNVLLDIVEAVLEEGAEEAEPLSLCGVRLLVRGTEIRASIMQLSVTCLPPYQG